MAGLFNETIFSRWMMAPLTNPQRRKLKALAQRLEPVLKVGRSGLSEAFVKSAEQALEIHELIKIRFDEFKDRRRELAGEIATRSGSQLVWIVGHVAVFFRRQTDSAKQKVRLSD